MKKFLFALFVLLLCFFCGCGSANSIKNANDPKIGKEQKDKEVELKIITTNKLLYSIVKQIVKDKHDVQYLFMSREEEENFDMNSDKIALVNSNDLFVYNGVGYEVWAQKFIGKLNKNKVGIVNCSRGIKLISYLNEIKFQDTVLKENPYYLYELDNYKVALLNIKNAIEDKDPKNRSFYEDNFNNALKSLEPYEKQFDDISEKMKDCLFLTDGEEMDYFLKNTNLKYIKTSKEDKSKLQSKIKDNKNTVFLYFHDEAFIYNSDIIYKNNIKTYKLNPYTYDEDMFSTLQSNLKTLNEIYDNLKEDDNVDETNKEIK